MTTTVTIGEGKAAVFMAVDHCTPECIGIHASKSQSRFEALEPLRRGVREKFGAFAENVAEGLEIRHDHGSQYMADDFQERNYDNQWIVQRLGYQIPAQARRNACGPLHKVT